MGLVLVLNEQNKGGIMLNFLSGWKTYITGAAAILTAIGMYAGGTITLPELLAAIFTAIQTMNLRHALTTTVSDATGKTL